MTEMPDMGSGLRFQLSGEAFILLVAAIVTFSATVHAQESPTNSGQATGLPELQKPKESSEFALLPPSEASIQPTASPPKKPGAHPFWDRTNRMLFSGVALFRALDYASTRNMQARGREEILLPDEVVNNSAGFASLEAASAATSVGLSYWMHRAGHHPLERWISIVHLSMTGFGAVRNYSLESKHPLLKPR